MFASFVFANANKSCLFDGFRVCQPNFCIIHLTCHRKVRFHICYLDVPLMIFHSFKSGFWTKLYFSFSVTVPGRYKYLSFPLLSHSIVKSILVVVQTRIDRTTKRTNARRRHHERSLASASSFAVAPNRPISKLHSTQKKKVQAAAGV